MKKNVAGQKIGVQMVSATDGSAFTGTVTVYITGDAGTQAIGSVSSGACTHEGNGYHTYAPSQAESNYDLIAFTFTGSGAVPVTIQVYTTFPQTGDAYVVLGAPAGASVSADVAAVKAQTAAIETDTQDLQTRFATAQADLDILTGTDGAILATTQANYAPAKAGDEMDLVNAPNATAVTAIQSGLSTHSAADVWSVGTRVLTAGTNIVLAKGTGITGFNDIAATDIVSGGAINTSSGAVSNVTTVATTTNLTNLPTIPNNWITAAGIAADAITSDKVAASVHQELLELAFTYDATATYATADAGSLVKQIADNAGGSALTAADIADAVWEEALADHEGTAGSTAEALASAGGSGASAADIADAVWDEALSGHASAGTAGKIVADILDDTGTSGVVVASGSKSGYSLSQSFPSNFASLAINASGHVVLQDASLVTAKLGTFALAKGTNITGFNDLSAAQVNAEVDSALADYDAPTKDELDALQSHGDSTWATATGFSTHDAASVAALILATPANLLATDVSGRVTVGTNADKSGYSISGTITTLDALDTAQDAQHATTQAKTNNLPASPAATSDIPSVSDIWTTALTEAYRATGATGTAAQLLYELIAHLGNSSIAGTTKTLKKLDGSTTAKTYTLDDDTTPTSIEEES